MADCGGHHSRVAVDRHSPLIIQGDYRVRDARCLDCGEPLKAYFGGPSKNSGFRQTEPNGDVFVARKEPRVD